MASRPPQLGPLLDPFRFRPFPHWDPVPPWLLDHIDIGVLKKIGAIQLRVERAALEQQVKALAEVEKLIQS
jgi:hypothetical protein